MKEQLITTINSFCGESIPIINIYLLMRDQNDKTSVVLRHVDTRGDSNDKLAGMFIDFLKRRIVEEPNLRICSLKEEESVGAVYHYSYAENPKELDVFWNFQENLNTEEFNSEKDKLSQLFGFVIVLKNENNKYLVMFKKHYAFSVIRSDKALVGFKRILIPKVVGNMPVVEKIFPYEEMYAVSTESDLIQLDGTVHMIRLDGQVYVLDPRVLDQMAGVQEAIKIKAANTLNAIKEYNFLKSVDLLDPDSGNIRYARKLARIGETSPVMAMLKDNTLKIQDVVAFTKKPYFEGLFSYEVEAGTEKIVLGKGGKNSRKAADAFLHLLSDSYLISELTKKSYASFAKEQLSEKAEATDKVNNDSPEQATTN